MKPIHMRLGRHYWTTTCATPGCGAKLPLCEIDRDAPIEERDLQKAALAGQQVDCSICVKHTVVEDRKLFVNECR